MPQRPGLKEALTHEDVQMTVVTWLSTAAPPLHLLVAAPLQPVSVAATADA
jgi:hypothetical protein